MPLGWDAAPKKSMPQIQACDQDLVGDTAVSHWAAVQLVCCHTNKTCRKPTLWGRFETCSLGCWGKVVHGTPQTMCRRRGPAGPVAALDCPGNSVLWHWAEWSRVSFYCPHPQHVMSLVGSQSHHVTSPLSTLELPRGAWNSNILWVSPHNHWQF